jgi:hypothetical protein
MKEILTTRLAQLIARYGAIALLALAAKWGVKLDGSLDEVAAGLLPILAAIIGLVWDHYVHSTPEDEKPKPPSGASPGACLDLSAPAGRMHEGG